MWGAPKGKKRDFESVEYEEFRSLEEFRRKTGQEKNGVLLDTDIFEKMILPDPATPHVGYASDSVDFRLRRDSAAVDAGLAMPNINDGYSGAAPDLGALELGSKAVAYGPRGE